MAHERQIHITQHAYERYCERVEPISYSELKLRVEMQMLDGIHHKRGYVQIGEIWWRGSVTAERIELYSCYGETHVDIPAAVKWAKRFGDRIALGGDR